MTVIAMTREMGSLGKDVAAALADQMGLKVVHHELVEHGLAERLGGCKKVLSIAISKAAHRC